MKPTNSSSASLPPLSSQSQRSLPPSQGADPTGMPAATVSSSLVHSPSAPQLGFGGGGGGGVAIRRQQSVSAADSSRWSRNPAEFTLQTVFADFVRSSEAKIHQALLHGLDDTVELSTYFRQGVDEDYDRMLTVLGSIAKHRPRPLIDAIMIWRKYKGEPIEPDLVRDIINGSELANSMWKMEGAQVVLKEKKMLASNFVLSRALMEVLQNLDPFTLSPDLGEKLEEMIYGQLKHADPESMVNMPNRQTNFDLFAKLLGTLSGIRFSTICNRFIKEFTETTLLAKESKMELMMRGMRFIKLKLYPENALDETVDFLSELGELYKKTHSAGLKYAYTHILNDLLLPLAQAASAEVNIPTWMKAIEVIYAKATKMSSKPRHLLAVTPLLGTCLCVSKRDFFLSKWFPYVEQCLQKMKDKTLRVVSLKAVSRLIWVYLYRCTEAITSTYKRLDQIIKVLFPPGRKAIFPPETPLEYFLEIVTIIGARYPDYGVKNIVFYLLNLDSNVSNLDSIGPERAIIALRLFILLSESKDEARPNFPQSDEPEFALEKKVAVKGAWNHTDKPRFVDAHDRICAYLGKIIPILHTNFGGYSLLDERMNRSVAGTISSSNTTGGSSIDLSLLLSREKQPFYDLMKTWIMCLPTLMPHALEERDLFDLLCKYTAHVDPDLSAVANTALLRLCRERPTMQINLLRSFGQFLIQLPDRVDEFTEKSLNLFLDMLGIWMQDVGKAFSGEIPSTRGKSENPGNHDPLLLWGKMQELETIGLLFLASALPSVRTFAIRVLEVAAELFEKYLKKQESNSHHVIQILRSFGLDLAEKFSDDYTNIVESLQDKKTESGFLLAVICSELPAENNFWLQVFPIVIKRCFEKCPSIVYNCSEHIYQRLLLMQNAVIAAADPTRAQNATLTSRFNRSVAPASDEVLEQWKFYLLFAFATETTLEPSAKKGFFKRSAPSPKAGKSMSAQELFRMTIPFLSSDRSSLRFAAVLALGHTNWAVFRELVDTLQPHIKTIIEDMRARYMRGSQKRLKKVERVRAEITHVFLLAAENVLEPEYLQDENLVSFMLSYIRELGAFLSDADVQMEWDHQVLRYYFCGFVEHFYNNIAKMSRRPDEIVPFDLRFSLFKLMEEWCGYGQRGNMMREREAKIAISILEQVRDPRERTSLTSAMEEQRNALEYASLRAMAALCKGQLVPSDRTKFGASFNVETVFEWIQSVFQSTNPRLQPIARSAAESLLLYNQRDKTLWQDIFTFCYHGERQTEETTNGYFQALASILMKVDYPIDPAMILNLILFKCGDGMQAIRLSSVRLLTVVASRLLKRKYVNDYEVAILSLSAATYRHGRYLISAALAQEFPALNFQFLSEVFSRLNMVGKGGKRSMLTYMLPWLDNINLAVRDDKPKEKLHVKLLLNNLVFLTVHYGDDLEQTVQSLWHRLASNVRNIRPIMNHVIQLCLEKRSSVLAAFMKRVVVYIGRTHAFNKLVEILVSELVPKAFVVHREPPSTDLEVSIPGYYTAPLSGVIGSLDEHKISYSRGQLVTVFMDDFAIEMGKDLTAHLPLLLHLVFVQVDQLTSSTRGNSKQLLVSLLHAFGERSAVAEKETAQKLIEFISDNELCVTTVNGVDRKRTIVMPDILQKLLQDTVAFFEGAVHNLKQGWGSVAVRWATACPVRHIACRSLQIYRTLQPEFNQKMLAELLARLSNTIADPSEEVQSFVSEILTTLELVVRRLNPKAAIALPQLFWACHFCMFTCNEMEYHQLLKVMAGLLEVLPLDDPSVGEVLKKALVDVMEGEEVPGILFSIGRGFSSSKSALLALECMNHLVLVTADDLVDNSGLRLLFTMLFATPQLAVALQLGGKQLVTHRTFATHLSQKLTMSPHWSSFGRLFESYAQGRTRSKEEFLKTFALKLVEIMREDHAGRVLSCLLQQLRNENLREAALEILRSVFANIRPTEINMSSVEPESLRNLYLLFSTEQFQESLAVLNDFIKLFADANATKFLFGNRAIQKLAKERTFASSFLKSPAWPYSDADMKMARGLLSKLVASYFTERSGISPPKTTLFSADAWSEEVAVAEAQESPLFSDLEPIEDYEELVNQLETLEDFFQVEDVAAGDGVDGDADKAHERNALSMSSTGETVASYAFDDYYMDGQQQQQQQLPITADVPPLYVQEDDRYSSEEDSEMSANREEESDEDPTDSGGEDDEEQGTFALEGFLTNRQSYIQAHSMTAGGNRLTGSSPLGLESVIPEETPEEQMEATPASHGGAHSRTGSRSSSNATGMSESPKKVRFGPPATDMQTPQRPSSPPKAPSVTSPPSTMTESRGMIPPPPIAKDASPPRRPASAPKDGMHRQVTRSLTADPRLETPPPPVLSLATHRLPKLEPRTSQSMPSSPLGWEHPRRGVAARNDNGMNGGGSRSLQSPLKSPGGILSFSEMERELRELAEKAERDLQQAAGGGGGEMEERSEEKKV